MAVEFSTVLLDIEGTTTPVDFVYRVLFPYAREHLSSFIEQERSSSALLADFAVLKNERDADAEAGHNPPGFSEQEPLPYLYWLMDQDRKSPGLKSIQGRIWAKGYEDGSLKGEVYPDVLPAIQKWRSEGKQVCIYSSGSILAQKLLFANLPEGDVTGLLDAHFDTSSGPKVEPDSYVRIAKDLQVDSSQVLFISDAVQEVTAAKQAGMQVLLITRPEEKQIQAPAGIETIRDMSSL